MVRVRLLIHLFSPDSSATVILATVRSSFWLFAVRITAASLTRGWVSDGFFSDTVARWSYKASSLYVWWFKQDKSHLTNSYVTNMWNFVCVVINCLQTALWSARHWVNGQPRHQMLHQVCRVSPPQQANIQTVSARCSAGVCYCLGSKATLSWLSGVLPCFWMAATLARSWLWPATIRM